MKEWVEIVFVCLWTKCNNNSKGLEWTTTVTYSTTTFTTDKNIKGYLKTRTLWVNYFIKFFSGALFMSIHKEQFFPNINNCRCFPNFVDYIEGDNINYTQYSNKVQSQIVTAFSPLIVEKSEKNRNLNIFDQIQSKIQKWKTQHNDHKSCTILNQ